MTMFGLECCSYFIDYKLIGLLGLSVANCLFGKGIGGP